MLAGSSISTKGEEAERGPNLPEVVRTNRTRGRTRDGQARQSMQFSLEDYADVDGGGDAVVCLTRVFFAVIFSSMLEMCNT